MVGGAVMAYMGGLHFWWPKITGRLYPDLWARFAAAIIFIGFNLTFFPQFVLGYLGMPRRYAIYPAEFQVLNVMSSAGASILGIGYVIPLVYFIWSMRYGPPAGPNPWGAKGLEWTTSSPPPTENFERFRLSPKTRTTTHPRVPMSELAGTARIRTGFAHQFEDIDQQREAGRLGMWVFLVTEILFFGGMFTSYTIYRALHLESFITGSHLLEVPVWRHQHRGADLQQLDHGPRDPLGANRQEEGPDHLLADPDDDFGRGVHRDQASFRVVPRLPGRHHSRACTGFTTAPHAPGAKMFMCFYFFMTGLHAIHMVIGLGILAVLVGMTARNKFSARILRAARDQRTVLALC